jgi:hypothetical protein
MSPTYFVFHRLGGETASDQVGGLRRGRVREGGAMPDSCPQILKISVSSVQDQGSRPGFTWQDYRDLLVRAHIQLGGPVVVVWDNLNVHRCSRLRDYAAEHDWLTIVQLPSY